MGPKEWIEAKASVGVEGQSSWACRVLRHERWAAARSKKEKEWHGRAGRSKLCKMISTVEQFWGLAIKGVKSTCLPRKPRPSRRQHFTILRRFWGWHFSREPRVALLGILPAVVVAVVAFLLFYIARSDTSFRLTRGLPSRYSARGRILLLRLAPYYTSLMFVLRPVEYNMEMSLTNQGCRQISPCMAVARLAGVYDHRLNARAP